MKKSVEIVGLPIISITEGRELGISKSLLIDAKNGLVSALIIEDEDWYRGIKLLPYDSVIAIGDDAITITNSENILTIDEAADYESMLAANVRVIGTKAITKSGSIQGIVQEIFIDESGKIAKCVIAAEGSVEAKEISAEDISIFGKQVTIIDSTIPEKAADLTAQKKTESVTAAVEPAVKAEEKPAETAEIKTEASAQVVETALTEEIPPVKAEAAPPEPAKAVADQAAPLVDKATEERHRRFLLGKKAARRLTTDNGIAIVEAGAIITEEVLQKAKLANKFIELSMNIQ